jgi:pimeloyl-ACP methyl ester carboxylesterase
MTTFVLLPGAGGAAWYWSQVAPRLEQAGHEAIAVDLPGDDDGAGLNVYTRLVVDAIDGRSDVALVAQSLGGFTAAMVCARVPVASLTFVNAMVPVPHERAGDWWANTDAVEARESAARAGGYGEFDVQTYFLHDVRPDVVATGEGQERPEADAVFASECAFDAWPSIPIHVLAGKDDRFFPVDFQRRVALERLGIQADVLPGGHLIALSQPERVAGYLVEKNV